MSVSLLTKEEINRTYETLIANEEIKQFVTGFIHYKERNKFLKESPENFIGRALWYGHVANITAYNLQYQENEPIDFKDETEYKPYEDLQEAINILGSLDYNIDTNDGNYFIMDDWRNVIQMIYRKFKEEETVEMPSWCY